MRALLPRESVLRPTPSTEPALFLEARAPVGSTSFDVCHADPLRVVAAERAFTTNPPTSDIPFVACRHPQPGPSGESSSYVWFAPVRPTYAVDLATADSCTRMLAHPRPCPDSAAFRRRDRRRPACQNRSYALPVKGIRSLDSGCLPPYRRTANLRLRFETP